MIETTEEEAAKAAKTTIVVKKTHKGDIEVDDSDMRTLELHVSSDWLMKMKGE